MDKLLLLFRRLCKGKAPFAALLLCAPGAVVAAPGQAGQQTAPKNGRELPARTSRYNQGNAPGRIRDESGKVARFAVKNGEAPLLDGAGREMCRVRQPVLLNSGAVKEMTVKEKPKESFVWAWRTEAGSGWIARSALVSPPPLPPADADTLRNPRPPRESEVLLTIGAAGGRKKLAGLRHVSSNGEIPPTGGNKGEHYGGRMPGPKDFVYLLFAVPNVRRGGLAKDSFPDGGKFIPALDEQGKPIQEVMTMYRGRDLTKPVPVTFLYGRAPDSDRWGWIARANVGER